jgi:DNA replication protein DnaC
MNIPNNFKTGYILYGPPGTGKTTAARNLLMKLYQHHRPDDLKGYLADVARLESRREMYRACGNEGALDALVNRTFPYDNGIGKMKTAIDIADKVGNKKETIKQIANTMISFIDDIGKESIIVKSFGTELQPIQDYVFERYDMRFNFNATVEPDKLVDIYTCNVPEGMSLRSYLKSTYNEAVADRILELCKPVLMDGTNWRLENNEFVKADSETNLF